MDNIGMMSGDTCNVCDGCIECSENALMIVCPNCGKATSVCANCRWHFGDGLDCDNCPFKSVMNKINKTVNK